MYVHSQKLKAIASSASNTWGLFLLIVLLGYALVDVPRKLWFSGNPEMCLQRSYFQLSKLCSDFEDAEMELKDIIQVRYAMECFNLITAFITTVCLLLFIYF